MHRTIYFQMVHFRSWRFLICKKLHIAYIFKYTEKVGRAVFPSFLKKGSGQHCWKIHRCSTYTLRLSVVAYAMINPGTCKAGAGRKTELQASLGCEGRGREEEMAGSQAWWRTPLIPALGRQRQVDFWVWGQPGLQSEFQDSQGYTEKPCLEKPKKKKKKRKKCYSIFILLFFWYTTCLKRQFFKKNNIHKWQSDDKWIQIFLETLGIIIVFTDSKVKLSWLWWLEYALVQKVALLRRCSLIGVGLPLLEEVCHCGCGL
jgi:hypothetical protein